MDIYWIKDKRKCGPAPVPDVISLIQMGELTPDTKGWHSGVQGWVPLKELPAFADFLDKPAPAATTPPPLPAAIPEGPRAADGAVPATPSPFAPHAAPQAGGKAPFKLDIHINGTTLNPEDIALPTPGSRLMARLMDTALYSALGMGVLYAVGAPYDCFFSPFGRYTLFFWTPMLLIEAYMLSKWGTTPGKKLMGISLCTFGPQKELTYSRALQRALFAFILGMGMLISFITVIMMFIAYWMLRSRGICWWDMRALTIPVCVRKPGARNIVVFVAGLYLLMSICSFFMRPWILPMYNDLYEISPDSARILEPLIEQSDLKPAPQQTQQQ